jgi:hypothetical protein
MDKHKESEITQLASLSIWVIPLSLCLFIWVIPLSLCLSSG